MTPGTTARAAGAPSASILLIEDEVPLARVLCLQLQRAGHECVVAGTLAQARQELARREPELVLLDIRLPDGNGLDFLEEVKAGGHPGLPVVLLTSFASVEDAVRAMKSGAADYLTKPESAGQTMVLVEKALHAAQEASRLLYARQRESHALLGASLRGESAAIRGTREEIRRIAAIGQGEATPPTVLILGETGSGKDLAARLLHLSGPRADRPFVQVDCAALPHGLFESELFGHEKGAFTQAHESRSGLIEAAEDGTLFLDEIGEVPLELQAKLLAVLDRRRLRRVGSTRERLVEARILAATNRDLGELVARGRFRSDLYFRLKVLTLTMPALRERNLDVELLARDFAGETARRHGLEPVRFSSEGIEAMRRYPWPGNVRELKHLMERAVLLHPGAELGGAELGLRGAAAGAPAAGPDGFDLAARERHLIQAALERAAGNISQAARLLGLSRGALRNRLERHGLLPGGGPDRLE